MVPLKNIMVVENEDEIREIVQICLKDLGHFIVTECSSGHEAVEQFAETKPQMILMDVMMPGINGMETFEKIQKLPDGHDVPVVFVTARAHDIQVKQYMKMGVAGVIAKPFDPITIARELTEIWSKHSQRKAAG